MSTALAAVWAGEPEGSRSLTEEQRAAVEARDRDVFCEAGAGSGKTRVLVERYCEAVASDDVAVEEVLAFTFTERAAAELRERVRRELTARARAAGDPHRARVLASLARATERSWVMTIHGFCRRLLAAHPLAAGLDPRFRVLAESEAGRLRERAITDALADVAEAADGAVAQALAAYRPYRLGDMTIAAHARLRSQGMAAPRLPAVPDPIRTCKDGEEVTPLSQEEAAAAIAARTALERLLEAFSARYEAMKEARSALDFADLELLALGLLRDSPAVGAAWRGRFTHLMVDEFQDTNRVQLALVEALRDADTRLFVVGDEQQSIYRFRNADLEVFRAERARAAADPQTEVLSLRGNFRSSPQVLDTVNRLGKALIGDAYVPLTGGRPGEEAPTELLLTLDEGRGKTARNWLGVADALQPPPSESTPSYVAEARALAERLRELVDAEEARRGEIVVLLRAFTHVDAYEQGLARFGLDPHVLGGRGYWSQQQVEDLTRLLGTISNPLDDELLFGALASPAVGVSPDALWLLRRGATENRHIWPTLSWRFGAGREPTQVEPEWLDSITAADGERLERFCATLARLRAEAPVVTIEALIERAMSAFDYDLELLSRPNGAARMANVRKLKRLAREFERHEGRDLAGFLAAAEASTRRDEREGMAAVNAEEHDGVRVMTVHAAKGLEFPVVAVPDLGRSLTAGYRPGDVVIEAGSEPGEGRFGMRLVFPTTASFGLWELQPLHEAERAAEAEEGCRLVYVAATRAQRRLILSGTFKPSDLEPADEAKPTDSPLRRFLPALAAQGWNGEAGELAAPPLRVRISEPTEARAASLARRLAPSPGPAEPEASGSLGLDLEPPARAVPVGHLSYSSLADYERCGYRFYSERVLGLAPGALALSDEGAGEDDPRSDNVDELPEPEADGALAADPRARSLAFGNAVHAALEWSGRNDWDAPDPGLLAGLLDGDSEAAGRALGLVQGWLGSDLLAELRGSEPRSEMPFAIPLGGIVVRGKIDLLVRTPRGPVVVDFKTDALHGSPPSALADRYRAQRELYALVAAEEGELGVRAIHLFLEDPASPVVEAMGPLELAAARERLAGLIDRIRGGDFTPTDTPTSSICFGCPAAWNLCPHPAWRPRR
ncbi:MAG: hypothetical protein QOJ01_1948 [Solirubrobacterales bacterium]|nr:hypothetical protein [Solirubrobacterales bacterium]